MTLKHFGTQYGVKKNTLMRNHEWIKNLQTHSANIQEQQWSDIGVEEFKTALKKSHKWNSARIDQVSNYSLNSLCKGHYTLHHSFLTILKTWKTLLHGYLK